MRPPHAGLRTAYANGLRYCAHCRYWVKAAVEFCPVCGRKYRRSVRRKVNSVLAASEPRSAFEIFMAHYGSHCTNNTVLYPEVAETISFLAEKYSLAVLTNKSATFSHKILTALKIDSYFKEVLGGDSLPTKKPDPAGILYLADKWGLAPDQLVMVGDHATDIEVGQRAGCKTVFIEGGIGETRGLKPDFVIKSMDELPDLFV